MPIYLHGYVFDNIEEALGSMTEISGSVLYNHISETNASLTSVSGSSMIEGWISNISEGRPDNSLMTSTTGSSARLYLDTYNNTNTFGSSFRGRRFRGSLESPSGVLTNDVLLQLVGDGYSSGNIENATASIIFYAAENFQSGKHGSYIRIRTTPTGGSTQLERVLITSEGNIGIDNSNPIYKLDVGGSGNFTQGIYWNNLPVIKSGDLMGTGLVSVTWNGSKFLISGIQGGAAAGVSSLNSLTSTIDLISSDSTLNINITGNNINLRINPQNSIIYRNNSNQITGVQKNADFVKIYRNNNDKITGVYYNNYYKKVLLDNDSKITGINVIYI